MENTELQEQLVRIKQQLEDCREENNRKLKTAYEDCANIRQGLEKKVQKMTLAAAVTGTVVGGEVLSKVTETVEQVTGLTDTLGAAPKTTKDPYALDLDWITPEIEMPDNTTTGNAVFVEGNQDSIFDAKEGMKFDLFEDSWADIPNPAQELETEADLTQAEEKETFFLTEDEDYLIDEGFGYFIARAEVEELVEEVEAEESLIELVVEEEEPAIAIEQSAEKEVIFTKPEEYIPPPPVILPPEPEMIIVAESKGVWALPLLLFWKRRRRNG